MEILKVVFLTYFRILKHSRHSPLLQPVLEGLAKWVQLSQFIDTVMYLIRRQICNASCCVQCQPMQMAPCSVSLQYVHWVQSLLTQVCSLHQRWLLLRSDERATLPCWDWGRLLLQQYIHALWVTSGHLSCMCMTSINIWTNSECTLLRRLITQHYWKRFGIILGIWMVEVPGV